MSGSFYDESVVVTAANPAPGRDLVKSYLVRSGTGFEERYVTESDEGRGLNVYVAGGAGPLGAIPVSQTNPTPISLSGVSIGGIMEVTTSAGNPVQVTGSVYVLNPASSSVQVQNWPATQSVAVVSPDPLRVSGSVGVVGTASVVLQGQSGPVEVVGTASVTGSVAVTNFPAPVTGVEVLNLPATQTVAVAGQVAVSQTNPVGSVSVLNLPATQSVYVVNSQGSDVRITGSTVALGVTGSVTAAFTGVLPVSQTNPATSVSVSNLPATQSVYVVNQQSSAITGTVDVTGTVHVDNPVTGVSVLNLPTTQSVYVVNQATGTSAITGTVDVTGTVAVSNIPATQSVYVVNQTSGSVQVDGTASVAVQNWPQVQQVQISGVVPVAGFLPVTGTLAVSGGASDVSITSSVPLPISSSQGSPVWVTGNLGYVPGGQTFVFIPTNASPTETTVATVAQTATLSLLLSASSRVGFTVYNSSSAPLAVFLGASTTSSFVLPAGAVYEAQSVVFTGEVYGEWPLDGGGAAVVTSYFGQLTGTSGSLTLNVGNLPATQSVYVVNQSSASVNISGALEVTSSQASPVWVTGSVATTPPTGTTPVTGTVHVDNASLTVDSSAGPLGVTGTVSVGTHAVTQGGPWSVLASGTVGVTQSGPLSAQVSGSVTASISNFPATQQVTGTVHVDNPVTSLSVSNFPATQQVTGTVHIDNPVVTITGSVTVNNPSSGTSGGDVNITASVPLDVTSSQASPVWVTGSVSTTPPTGTTPITGTVHVDNPVSTVSVSNLPATQAVTGTVHVDNPTTSVTVNNFPSTQAVTGSVAVTATAANPVAITDDGTPVQVAPMAQAGSVGTSAVSYVAAATNNATTTKASPGNLYGYYGFNSASYTVFVKFYNKASAPAPASDTPVFVIGLPAGGGANATFAIPISFGAGISFAMVKGIASNDNTSVAAGDAVLSLVYA